VASLQASAGRLLNRVSGASDRDYDAEAVKAFAVLAFPSRRLPEAVRSAMRSDFWRSQLDGLTVTEQSNISEIVLNNAFTEVDLRSLFRLAREGKDRAGEISLLAELGLLPAAYDALLARLERGEDSDELSMALLRYEYSCTSAPFYSRWITPMRGYDRGCGADPPEDLLSVQQLERLAKHDLARPLGIALGYLEGRGVEPDSARALALIERPDSTLLEKALAAAIYQDGRGVAPDLKRAVDFYEQVARLFESSSSSSQAPVGALATRYGTLLMEGWGVTQDVGQAIPLLRLGVRARAPRAEVALADALLLGLGVEADEQEAFRWYRQAARDEPTALVRFGFLAASGRWRERNLPSRRWYDLAEQAKTPQIWIELARAEAYGSSPRRTEILRLLRLAAAKKNGWSAQWLAACPRGAPECVKRQPGFARTFFLGIASRAKRTEGSHVRKGAGAATILKRDVDHLRRQIRAAVSRGEGSYGLRDRLREIERIQTYHGDVEGAIGTRLRLLLAEDGSFAPDGDSFGASALGLLSANRINYVSEEDTAYRSSFGRYRAAMDSSCRWGLASRMAENLGRRSTALLFAKIAVNRLQEAREFLSGLDSDVRECFLEMHKDRYRWLADLLIQSERLAEAEVVLGMLKDFEQAAYLHDSTQRGGTTRRIAFSPAESRQVARLQSLSAEQAQRRSGTTDGTEPSAPAALIFRYEDEGIQDSIDAIARELAASDLKDGQPASIDRLVRLTSFNRAVVADLQERLPPGTVALHAVVLPDRVHWILATAKGRKSFTIRIRQTELEEAIGAFRAGIVEVAPDIEERSGRVYELVFGAVDRELSRLGVRTVMLSLDRRLRYLPFAALHDGTRWLTEKYAFTTFRQQGDYLRPLKGLPWKVAAFAATRPAFGLDSLPSAGAEIERIVRSGSSHDGILEGQRRVDSEFTREALIAALKGDFRVVHIASHFVLDPIRDADSFLLLGDGSRLPLQDMRSSSDFTFSRADLVTLSACQTALGGRYGDGREVDTLGDVAQNAGAPAVLASLWSVDDESTAALMVGFYRRRVSDGLSLAEALRAAQLHMLRQPPKTKGQAGQTLSNTTAHPFYWAPFILSGNGR
jgi:CHAT domain-containing protein/TPR repeat protein